MIAQHSYSRIEAQLIAKQLGEPLGFISSRYSYKLKPDILIVKVSP
jgi:hypothetical protein